MPVEILLVEDAPGDVRLTQEASREASDFVRVHVVGDGGQAMAFLRQEGAYRCCLLYTSPSPRDCS